MISEMSEKDIHASASRIKDLVAAQEEELALSDAKFSALYLLTALRDLHAAIKREFGPT